MSGLAMSRSTTASIVRLFFLSRRTSSSTESTSREPHAGESGFAHGVDDVTVLALALLYEGGEEQELRARGRSATSATICWLDCWETGRPQL